MIDDLMHDLMHVYPFATKLEHCNMVICTCLIVISPQSHARRVIHIYTTKYRRTSYDLLGFLKGANIA